MKMPEHIHVHRHGGRTFIQIDGELFDVAHAHPTIVTIDQHEGPGVQITLIANRVTVDDDLLRSQPEPDWFPKRPGADSPVEQHTPTTPVDQAATGVL